MSEADLSKRIAAKVRERGGWARKIAGGPSQAGLPDVLVCYRGHFVGIETKLPGKEGTLTPNQANTLTIMKAAGGITIVATSWQQVWRLLDRIDALYE